MFNRILVPLDGSKTAEKVLPHAQALAALLEVPVELLEVVDIADMAAHLSSEKARYLETFFAEGERQSENYLAEVARNLSGLKVDYKVERGRPEEIIISKAAADERILIAMATHGRSGMSRWLLGSIAEKVLRGTSNPLLLVRAYGEGVRETSLSSVIVPLDGSTLAERALPTAVYLCKLMNLELTLLRCFELPAAAYYGSEAYLPNYDELKSRVREDAQNYLDAQVNALRAEGVARVSAVLTEGDGADEIIGYARKSPRALIIMCTHGRSGVRRWMLGSVTEKVVRHTSDPVIVVRAS